MLQLFGRTLTSLFWNRFSASCTSTGLTLSGLSVCPPYSGQEDAPSIRGQVYGIIFEVQSLEEEFTLDMSFQFLFNVNVMLCLVHVDAKYMGAVF